jgi:HK97 family phage major capsid protein
VDSEGGFLVAPEFAPGIWQRSYETSQLASRCFDQPMSSNRLVVPAVDEDSRADGSRWGGVQSFWLGESGTFTPSQPKFGTRELIAKKLIVLSYMTDELGQDAPAFASYLNKVVPQEFAFKIDDAIYNGTGAGMPMGFMNSGALLTIARDAGDTGAVITSKDIFHMWKRRFVGASTDLVWLINQDTEDQLWDLTRGSGTAVELLYTGPGARGNTSNYGVMFGKPVIPVEYAATLGTPGDIALVSLSQYYLARRAGVQMDTSIHVQFLTDQQAFRWKTPPRWPACLEEAADPEERHEHAVAVHRLRHQVVTPNSRLRPRTVMNRFAAESLTLRTLRRKESLNECKRLSSGRVGACCQRSASGRCNRREDEPSREAGDRWPSLLYSAVRRFCRGGHWGNGSGRYCNSGCGLERCWCSCNPVSRLQAGDCRCGERRSRFWDRRQRFRIRAFRKRRDLLCDRDRR